MHFFITHEICTLWNLLILHTHTHTPNRVFGGYLLTRVRVSLLKPTITFTYHQLQQTESLCSPHSAFYVFCVDLRTNSDYFTIQHQFIGFYNQGKECLLRGTNWVFKSDIIQFRHCRVNALVLKGTVTKSVSLFASDTVF